MVDGTPRRPVDFEPQRETIREIEKLAGTLVGDFKTHPPLQELLPPTKIGKKKYRSGNSVVTIVVSTATMPFTDDPYRDTEITVRDRQPTIAPTGDRNYPFKKVHISTVPEGSEANLRLGAELYRDTDDYGDRMQRSIDEHETAFSSKNMPASEADLQDTLMVLKPLTPEDLLDKYGRTVDEKRQEEDDIEAIESEVRRLALITRSAKIRFPEFVTPEGDTISLMLKQHTDGEDHSFRDIFPPAKERTKRVRDRITIWRRKTTGFYIDITRRPETIEGGSTVTRYRNYRAFTMEDRGPTMSTEERLRTTAPDGTDSWQNPKSVIKSFDEGIVDDTIHDPQQVSNITVGHQGRQEVLGLLRSLDATLIQRRQG